MLFSCSVIYRATLSRHLFGQSRKGNSANFALTEVATAQEQEVALREALEKAWRKVRENKDALTTCMSRIDPELAQQLEQDPVVARALGRRP